MEVPGREVRGEWKEVSGDQPKGCPGEETHARLDLWITWSPLHGALVLLPGAPGHRPNGSLMVAPEESDTGKTVLGGLYAPSLSPHLQRSQTIRQGNSHLLADCGP